MNSCKLIPPSDLGGADGRFVAPIAIAGLVFAEGTAFFGHLAGGAGSLSSRSEPESSPPSPAVLLGTPALDTTCGALRHLLLALAGIGRRFSRDHLRCRPLARA
ncbi:hypothetical protein PR003_g10768 [Phytophthora rubi]|uniref:Uncharacterized protein n=1 Tax=Phytophthora rubi TaxID=129364 RepID=A0A6A4F4U1_9STRA|nr:hypothetical protein PR003_g10768 [Phytophthora rubi]